MSTFAHSIRILELAANGARSNRAYQESFGTKQEAERQRKIEREHREAVGVLQAEAAVVGRKGCCAPAYVCGQCGRGMSMLPPPKAIEQMKSRLLCPICLAGVQFDRHNAEHHAEAGRPIA